MPTKLAATRELLLRRQGLVFVEPSGDVLPVDYVRAVEVKLADLGYVPSMRLRSCLEKMTAQQLTHFQDWAWSVLSTNLGSNQKHRPLFRKFPEDIPDDTFDLWIRKVLCHFLQGENQPCLFCGRVGTTHVLEPCYHVVCDACFDGSNYSACPVCEHHVDMSSPFFQPSPSLKLPMERVTFKTIDLCQSIDDEAKALFRSFCGRKQAMSLADKDDFEALLSDYGNRALGWLPESIPLKENVALVFGTLFRQCDAEEVLPHARQHLKTATDVLRFIAVYSGTDASLQRKTVFKTRTFKQEPGRFWSKVAELLRAPPPQPTERELPVPVRINRFKVAPLRRPLRRTLLAILEAMPVESLTEDMLRHRSYWVWVGEFMHPHEYKKRFPKVARAFEVVRKRLPDGRAAEPFRTFNSRLEAAAREKNADAMTNILLERPGEFARRFDHALRIADRDAISTERLVKEFSARLSSFSTPVLLTLHNFLPTRTASANVRIFWPKGRVSKGVSAPDRRPTLPADVVRPVTEAIERELLRRFGEEPKLGHCYVDRALAGVVAPFNERTASRSAVQLPRGSRIDVEPGKTIRMFLHWCEPEKDGQTTDLDLSVGFYDADWNYRGVCSYYELKYVGKTGATIATSAGDLQSAPYPDGASEFIDLERERALAEGIRYAVMVVNSYAGMPFTLLERVFAGVMLRDDTSGKHFDPRTVELKFELQGENGMYLPLVLDIQEGTLHWLDTYSKGRFQFNNVENSNSAIMKICPEMMAYFQSGVRMSMYELALLHAAARGRTVTLRGEETVSFQRQKGESASDFLARLRGDTGGAQTTSEPGDGETVFAALFKGDMDLPEDSRRYVLFPEKLLSNLSASDLIV